ncbi:penicillin acylase family protein [Undibacterium flavidum]|uniref:Penicillin acylase family protein n=1 Tax=Undibacterium flavidum TaxID=2762297 RepID=A0ABR6Y7I5_9BURK|nr:penicillin acylase family protein [Undibacterium flavidum]
MFYPAHASALEVKKNNTAQQVIQKDTSTRAPQQQLQQSWQVKELQQPVQILVDHWGVPHIYAKNQDDLFFAQGFNAARDRLFQLDLWRRRGLGQLSEVFGASFLEQDRAARLFLYRGDMHKEWAAYGQHAEQLSKRFVAGINAYVDYVHKNRDALPIEFKTLNYLPAHWLAEDVVRIRSHGLTRNLTSEITRAKFACDGNLSADEVRQRLSPTWITKVPEGLDPCLPDGILRQFTLATQNVEFDANTLRLSQTAGSSNDTLAQQTPLPTTDERQEGSNNWVIAPSKTSTGRAILANDPHRAYSAPSLRYIAHLSAPGLDVIGAGEPALPGISIGHNGTIAFGLTIMSIDQEDLYVYEINPANKMQYKYRGKWENFKKQVEVFQVKDRTALQSELLFTRHGPVIFQEANKNRAFAVRTGWLQAGMAPYFGSVDYMRAQNFSQFKKAMLHWGAPTENQVYADVKGNIGWVPGGLTPIRPNWDGLLPVPGDGRYEWAGFLSGDKLPSSYNPKNAWFASANEMNLPKSYPYRDRKLGFEWPYPARYQRIADVLSQDKKFSLEDSMQLQNDVLSLPAQRLTAILKTLKANDEVTQKALQVLLNWNHIESADSAAAALFQVWLTQTLAPAYKELMLDHLAIHVATMPDMTRMLDNLESMNGINVGNSGASYPTQFGNNPQQAKTARDTLLLNSLAAAYKKLELSQGMDNKNWRWGNLQKTLFAHPFSKMLDSTSRTQFDVGPLARGGSANTVNQSTYRLTDFIQLNGPSFRVVIDVGNWDNSRAVNAPGQSGDPSSPHYRDLAEQWAKGEYFPLLYSKPVVEKNTRQRFELVPLK